MQYKLTKKRVIWLGVILGLGILASCTFDNSAIDESSIAITAGANRRDFIVIHVDVNVNGLEGYDMVLPDKSNGFHHTLEMGYTLFYELYDPQGALIEKKMQDLGKYGNFTSFSRQELTIPRPQWWTEDNPLEYTLILRLKIVNKPLSKAIRTFRLEKDGSPVGYSVFSASCQEQGGSISQAPEAVRDSSCVPFTNEALIRQMPGDHVRIYHLSEAEMEEVDQIIAHRVTELSLMEEALPYQEYFRQMYAIRKGRAVQVYVQLFATTHWEENFDWNACEQGLLPPPGEFKQKKDIEGKYKAFREHYARELEVVNDGGYYYGDAGVNLTRKKLLWLYFNGPS